MEKNGYNLSKQWFEFIFETREVIRPIHTALYFWIVELNNRLKWKEVFGLPTQNAMQAICVNGRQHYKKALDDLIRWGFITLVSKSFNQYLCNQVKINLLDTLGNKQNIEPDTLPDTLSNKQTVLLDTLSLKQVTHSKTVKTKKEKQLKPKGKKNDFINDIIQEFKIIFPDYEITEPGKETKMAGKLLSILKKQYPDYDSAQMLKALRDHFIRCKSINDTWLQNNMSIPIMVSKYNSIMNILKNPGRGKKVEVDLSQQDYSLRPSEI